MPTDAEMYELGRSDERLVLDKEIARLKKEWVFMKADLVVAEARCARLERIEQAARNYIHAPSKEECNVPNTCQELHAALAEGRVNVCPNCGEAMDGIVHGRSECNIAEGQHG